MGKWYFRKVKYSDNRVYPPKDFKFEEKDPTVESDWQDDLIVTKAQCWAYEYEWRYIKLIKNNDESGKHKVIDEGCLSKVILGCRVSKEKQMKIFKVIREKWPGVSIYKAVPDNNLFSLNIEDIFDGHLENMHTINQSALGLNSSAK